MISFSIYLTIKWWCLLLNILFFDEFAEVVYDNKFILFVEILDFLNESLFLFCQLVHNNENNITLTQNEPLEKMLC
jgi:hypothetical protein